MTLIAASIAVHDAADASIALDRAAGAAKSGANMIEWRIDELVGQEHAGKLVASLVRGSPVPCIVTCRSAREGGEYRGDEQTRAEFFATLVQSDDRPRYIDVELSAFKRDPIAWKTVRAAIESQGDRDLRTGLILSLHDFDRRPPDLIQPIEQMIADPLCSVMKVAWHARSLRDNLEAFDLLR